MVGPKRWTTGGAGGTDSEGHVGCIWQSKGAAEAGETDYEQEATEPANRTKEEQWMSELPQGINIWNKWKPRQISTDEGINKRWGGKPGVRKLQ